MTRRPPRKDLPLAFRPHPWHGVDPGEQFPEVVRAYIEIAPTDGVKYEIDKHSGYLKVDRPQRYSSFCPTLYLLTYKAMPGAEPNPITVDPVYGAMQARAILDASRADYREQFGGRRAPGAHR